MPRLFFDNLDFKILVNIILQNRRPSDMHWIAHYVTFDRVPCDHLDDSKPLSDGTRFENIEYLLSQGELDKLRSDFIVLVARILADFFEFMEPLQSAILSIFNTGNDMPQLQLAGQAHGFAHPLILFQSAIIPCS